MSMNNAFGRTVIFLLLYLFLLTLMSELQKYLLDSNQLVLDNLNYKASEEQILDLILKLNKWEKISYILIPLLILLKVSVISGILDIGCFFFGKKIKYKKLFNIVVKAEFIFLLVIVFKTAWFYFFQTDYSLEDLQYFYPLSALNLIGYEGLQPWFIYPFQVLNLFELAYWFILAYLIGKEINDTKSTKGLQIVASSYGVSLLIWVVGVMFFTLNMS